MYSWQKRSVLAPFLHSSRISSHSWADLPGLSLSSVCFECAERRIEDGEAVLIADVGDGIAIARVLVAKARKAVIREGFMMEDV